MNEICKKLRIVLLNIIIDFFVNMNIISFVFNINKIITIINKCNFKCHLKSVFCKKKYDYNKNIMFIFIPPYP